MLSTHAITKRIDGKEILRGIDCDVAPGTITVVIGPSGSGKTTLLRALSLIDTPEQGTITVDNETYSFPTTTPYKQPWPEVSVVFQQLFVWPHLTLRENIELPLKTAGRLLERQDYIKELLAIFSMEQFIDRYPNEVSLGQRQRAALVRALALKPRYLLLDEITSSLDVEQSAVILTHLTAIKEQGIGIIMVAHDIDFALSIADDVLFLDKGRVVKRGKPYEFLLETQNTRISSFINDAFLGSPGIKVYNGKEEFQAYHIALLERLPEHSVIHVIGGVGDTWYMPMKNRYDEYVALRTKKRIVWKMLMYEYGDEDKRLAAKYPELNEFHLLSPDVKNMANINIMSCGTVILQIFHPTPSIIEIKNPTIAAAYLNYFNDLKKSSVSFR